MHKAEYMASILSLSNTLGAGKDKYIYKYMYNVGYMTL